MKAKQPLYVIVNAAGDYLGKNDRWVSRARQALHLTPEEAADALLTVPCSSAAWLYDKPVYKPEPTRALPQFHDHIATPVEAAA